MVEDKNDIQENTQEFKCYLEDCLLPALQTDDCFAYCSREHKAKVVMVDYQPSTKPRNLKEMQLRLKEMKERYLEKQKSI